MFPLGTLVVVAIEFRVSGVLTDPTTWRVEVTRPDGTSDTLEYGTDAELVLIDDGQYEYRQSTDRDDPTQIGRWCWWVSSTGAAQGSMSGYFVITDPRC